MIEQKNLKPGSTYLFTKEILGINIWFPNNQRQWAVSTGRKNLGIFLLPIGKVLGFTIVKNKLLIVIEFHSREVLEKVPRASKDQAYLLTAHDQDRYISGELPPIALEESPTYEGENLSVALRKRLANFLQSFTIQYNRHYGRKDRLSARYSGIFELEGEEDIKKVLTELQNTPLIHEDRRSLEACNTNTFDLEDKEIRKVISYRKVMELFGGTIKAFQDAARQVRKRLEEICGNFRYLQEVAPGCYFTSG
jgi:hypothetical protein